jgi:hypothetical protein
MIGSLVSNPKKIVIKGVGFYYIGNKNSGVFRTGGASSKNSNSIPAEEASADFIPKKVHKRGYKKTMHILAAPSQRRVKDTPLVHKYQRLERT